VLKTDGRLSGRAHPAHDSDSGDDEVTRHFFLLLQQPLLFALWFTRYAGCDA
jgi:hypothetical protein